MSDLLDMSLSLGDDGQDEGGRLIWTEGRRHYQVFAGLQCKERHHLTRVLVAFTLGNRSVPSEESGWELPPLCLEL